MSDKIKYIRIADCYFSMTDDMSLLLNTINYRPFLCEVAPNDADFLFHLHVDNTLSLPKASFLSQYRNEHGEYTVYHKDKVYFWQLQRKGDAQLFLMRLDMNLQEASLNFKVTDTTSYYAANDFLRFAFIYTAAACDTLLLHASCVTYQQQGIAFLGRSGIGKSTHSSLWLQHVPGAELLNDDQPAVRVHEGKAIVYGTPWSGKEPCYRAEQVPLKALFCMKQASENHLVPLSQTHLFSQLLSSCSLMKADRNTLPQILYTLSRVAESVRGAILENYPGPEAVSLSFQFFKTQQL